MPESKKKKRYRCCAYDMGLWVNLVLSFSSSSTSQPPFIPRWRGGAEELQMKWGDFLSSTFVNKCSLT
jgi:hypothetical protein